MIGAIPWILLFITFTLFIVPFPPPRGFFPVLSAAVLGGAARVRPSIGSLLEPRVSFFVFFSLLSLPHYSPPPLPSSWKPSSREALPLVLVLV